MPDLDQLEAQLGPELRALAAQPDPAWVRRVTASRRRRRPLLLPVAAIAASVLVALLAATALLMPVGGDDPGVSGRSAGGGAESGASAPQTADDAGGALAVPPTARSVERSAELTLATGDPQAAADELTRLTTQAGGFVASASVADGEGGGTGSLLLRVPSARLDALLARAREVGDVTALRREATDVTNAVGTAERLLADARDTRAALRRALGRATDPARIDALRARAARAGRLVERREAQLRAQRRRGALATVLVTLRADDGSGAWSPGDAPADALRVAAAVAGALLIALAAVSPLLVLVAALLLTRRLRRRRVLAG